MIPLALAVLASLSSWWAWETYGLRYSPDFELYTQGGIGLYPSPLGRIMGSTGEPLFVAISVVSCAFVVFLTYKTAGSTWASVALVCSPFLLYLNHAGIDPIGLAFYAALLAGIRPGLTGSAAALTHWTLLPFALLELVRRPSAHVSNLHKATAAAFLLPAALFVLIVTPYSGIVTKLGWSFFPYTAQGLAAGLLVGLPAIALYRFSRASMIGFLIGAAQVGAQHHLQARYLLPAVLLHVCAGELRDWPVRVMASLTTSGYGAMLRRRSLEMGAGGRARDPSTPTTTQRSVTSNGRRRYDTVAHDPACTIMDVAARVHPRASLWLEVGELLAEDTPDLTRPLACPTTPGKRQLLFEPTELMVRGQRNLHSVKT